MEAVKKSDIINMDSQLTKDPIHLQTILKYFMAFNEKDLDSLESLYSEDVTLKDWTGKWTGKKSVLDANQILFNEHPTLNITLNRIDTKSNTSYCYISILLEKEKLEVLDCIYLNEDGEISYIDAIFRDSTPIKEDPIWMRGGGL
jgi:ketosteroid isomerase-like protein